MKKITDWVKNKSAILSIALSNVEKNALSQTNEGLSADVNQVSSINQGKVTDSLINGQITQEVMDLRWRMYKVMEHTDNLTAKLEGYHDNGQPIYTMSKKSLRISKPNLDPFDNYKIEMIVNNEDVVKSIYEGLDDRIEESDSTEKNGITGAVTLGTISGHEYFTQEKNEKPLKVSRKVTPSFYLEVYTQMLKIRKIDDSKRLLEFYVSFYPDEYNRTSRLVISTIKKEIENKTLYNPFLDINGLSFISYKTQGVNDNYLFEYDNLVYDKIVTYNGYYIVKFIADVKIDGEYIMETYRQSVLDNKYENKEKK
jgi:hypothetical protein